MATLLDFDQGDVLPAGRVTVWTRQRWADDWELRPDLHCTEATWSAAPSLSVASFRWLYGQILPLGSKAVRIREKLTSLARAYVKVKFETWPAAPSEPDQDPEGRYWYGVFELDIDEQLGSWIDPPGGRNRKNVALGRQTLTAYGLEILLARHRIRTSWFKQAGTPTETTQRLTFNARGGGNATAATFDGAPLFEPDLTAAQRWTSRTIVKYLLARQAPRDADGTIQIPFALDTASEPAVADWDFPEISQEDSNTHALLSRILDRRRLTIWWLEVDENTTPHTARLKVDTLTKNAVPVSVPGADPIPANRTQIDLALEADPLTAPPVVRDSDVQRYDVVVCRGAAELCVGSFSLADGGGTIRPAWDSAEQALYEYGAAGTAGYSTAGTKEQQKRNAAARSAPALERVFSRFSIPDSWDGRVGNGAGGPLVTLFPDPLGGALPVYLPAVFLEPHLPLLVGVNYGGSAIASGITEPKTHREELDPLLFIQRPESGRWVRGEDLGASEPLETTAAAERNHVSISLRIPPRSRSIELRVHGKPQHAIAYGDFAPLGVDRAAGQFSFRTGLIVTLCLPNGRRVSGQWPPTEPRGIDAVRWLEIDAGEDYRKIYVAPGTVTGIDAEGALIRSTGGYIPGPGPENHETQLQALARIAAAWYTVPHRVLTLETQRLFGSSDLDLGTMIGELRHPTIDGGHHTGLNTPITEIRLTWPLAESDGPPPAPQLQLQTWAGELDPLQTGPSDLVREIGSKLSRIIKL